MADGGRGQSVVVSDIDGTVVFSGVPAPSRVSVEEYSSGRHGQMTSAAHAGWGRLARSGRLVVATTRTRDQFLRLRLDGAIRLAVVSNGFRVLVDGVEDDAWTVRVRRRLLASAAPPDDVIPRVHRLVGEHPGVRGTTSDEVLVTLVSADAEVVATVRPVLDAELAGTGWVSAQSGRKLYVLPERLDKGSLVAELLTDHGLGSYLAGGDSQMDASLVTGGAAGIVPRGSDLADTVHSSATVRVTDSVGVEAGSEVVAAYEAFLDG